MDGDARDFVIGVVAFKAVFGKSMVLLKRPG